MKGAIFSFVPVREKSMIASVRIARFVAERLDLPTMWDSEIARETLDLLVVINGAYAFSRHLPALAAAALKARRIVWVQNDYTIIPPKTSSQGVSPFRAAFRERHERGLPDMDYWTTCEKWQALTPLSRYVNWNALTFDEEYDERNIALRRENAWDDLFYYGAFRRDRERYFDRYFGAPAVPTTISTPSKHFDKYEKTTRIVPIRENFFNEVGSRGLGLYIEDRRSHREFHSPANRFYEMLSAGLPMVFQPESGPMLRRAGFDPEPYYASNAREVQRMFQNREDVGRAQRAQWIGSDPVKFRKTLESQFHDAWRATKKELG